MTEIFIDRSQGMEKESEFWHTSIEETETKID